MRNKKAAVAAALTVGALACGGLTASVAVAGNAWSTDKIRDGAGEEMAKTETSAGLRSRHAQALKASRLSQARLKSAATVAISGRRGRRGPRGPRGPRGLPGRVSVYTVTSPLMSLPWGEWGEYTAACRSGDKAISGGFIQDSTALLFANESGPLSGSRWHYALTNLSDTYDAELYFVTTCVS